MNSETAIKGNPLPSPPSPVPFFLCLLCACRHRQSRWIGSSILQQPSRRKKSQSAAQQSSSLKSLSLSPSLSDNKDHPPNASSTTSNNKERKPSPKKRSTMNSRDAAYDYSSLFPHGRDGGTSVDDNDPTKMDDTSPPGSRAGDSTSAHRRRRGGGGKRVADEDDEDTVSLARSSKRRRGSNETEEVMDTAPRGKKTSSKRKDTDSDNGREDSSSELHPHHHQGSATPLLDAPPASTSSRNGKRGGGPGNGKGGRPRPITAKSERVDSEEPPLTPTFRRNALDDVIRPARARVPQARSGMNEMRKRVGAILEYVGRLQADVAPATGTSTPCTLPSLHPLFCFFIFSRGLTVVDDSEGYDKPDLENAPSQLIMQYVTRRCLDFEARFGKYPGRYG